MPLVTPIPMTSGRVIMFAGLSGTPSHPIRPPSQSEPTATGTSASPTQGNVRKCTHTSSAIAASEYHAASS